MDVNPRVRACPIHEKIFFNIFTSILFFKGKKGDMLLATEPRLL